MGRNPGIETLDGVLALWRAGLLRPVSPVVVGRTAFALARSGLSPAAACEYGAVRFAREPAVVDDRGSLTFGQLNREVAAATAVLGDAGIGDADRVGILCRNHRDFYVAVGALSGLGADLVLMNVSFAAPQLAQAARTEAITALVHDEEFASLAAEVGGGSVRFTAGALSTGSEGPPDGHVLLKRLFPLDRPRSPSRYVLLTSGTTGAPRGTSRPVPVTANPLVALLSRIPLHVRDRTLIASPLFHAWGFAHLGLAMVLSSTVVLHDSFDPVSTLASVEENRVRVLVVVPVMLRRLLEVPKRTRRRYDLSSLEVVASSGSQLPASLATGFMDAFGDVLYNVYGSTEAAWAAIATPRDLRDAPGTAGRPPFRTDVRILDPSGDEVPAGGSGQIAVGNVMLAKSYSDGSGRGLVHGLLPTGDVGHIDSRGRLFVEGRLDEMIVSGGENVYPQEIEDLLVRHPAIADAAVTGVPDPEFGQRLRAAVVLREGFSLTPDELRAYVHDHLARFKVPRDVEFVDALPRNAIGKLERRQDLAVGRAACEDQSP